MVYADKFSLLKGGGGGGVVGQPLPMKRGNPSGIDPRSTPAKHNSTRVWSSNSF